MRSALVRLAMIDFLIIFLLFYFLTRSYYSSESDYGTDGPYLNFYSMYPLDIRELSVCVFLLIIVKIISL